MGTLTPPRCSGDTERNSLMHVACSFGLCVAQFLFFPLEHLKRVPYGFGLQSVPHLSISILFRQTL